MKVLSNIAPYYLLAIVCLLTGIVVVLKKPGDIRARLFFGMIFMATMVLFPFGSWSSRNISFDYQMYSALFKTIATWAFPYTPVFFLHFCLVFPTEKRIARSKLFLWSLYLLAAVVAILYRFRISFYPFHVFFIGALIGSILAMIHSYISLKSPYERAQIKWVLLGAGIFAAVFISTIVLPTLFGRLEYYNAMLPTVFFTLFPLTMALAITRYRLMDIDTLFDNTFTYTATLSILVLLDMGVIGFFSNLKSAAFSVPEPVATIIAVWLVIFAYVPVRNTVRNGVKRLLKREFYDMNQVALKLSGRFLTASDIASILDNANGILGETLHPRGGVVFLFREKKRFLLESGRPHLVSSSGDDWWMSDKAKELKHPRHLYSVCAEAALPGEYSAGVIMPLVSSNALLGYIMLKNKYSGNLYVDSDLKLLSVLANQTALAIEKIYGREEAIEKERETWEEKQRISREIHDGIGSNFTNAIMMVDLIGKDISRLGGRNEHLAGLKSLLAEGLEEIRDIVRTMDDEECTLGDMASSIKEKIERLKGWQDLQIDVTVELENEGIVISSKRLRNIMRILEESTANAIKHSGATMARIQLMEKDGTITVKISDNGRGFDVSGCGRKDCHGLRNMRKRGEEMGAELTIASEAGKGTEIVVIIGP